MNFSTRRPLLWPGLVCGCLLFALVLFACHIFSGGGGASTNPTPSGSSGVNTKPMPSGSGEANTNPPSDTNINPPSLGPELKTYTSYGYSIGYPKAWTYKTESRKTKRQKTLITTTFTDSQGVNALVIGVLANPDGDLATQAPLGGALKGFKSGVKNYQELAMAPQTTVSQQTCDQVAAKGDEILPQGLVDTKEIVIGCNHPTHSESTKLYYIIYSGPNQTFDDATLTIFQPMLASFVFS